MAILTNAGKALSASQMAGTTTTPPVHIGIGSGGTGSDPAATVTALVTPYTTGTPAARGTAAPSVVTTTVTGDTFQIIGQITAAVGAVAVNEAGLFTAASAGTMAVVAGFAVINLAIGDSIAITGQIKYT